jgi:hypothetical protein
MSFLAQAESSVGAPPEVAFDRLANHASWPAWMPASFRPVGPSKDTLRSGDAITVKIAGMPFPARLVVHVSRRPDEISWRGGVKGLLWAEHRFLFEADAKGGTRVRSVETWYGPLASVLRRAIQPRAERIGQEQLAGLARGVAAG